jgi:hypothetical protein
MSPRLYTIEEKIGAVDSEIRRIRKEGFPPNSAAQRHCDILKSVCADLRAREEFPRSNTLGEMTRLLQKVKDEPRGENNGYDHGRLIAFANYTIGNWPIISMALEAYGELSAE